MVDFLRDEINVPDVSPNGLSCVIVVHRSTMEPIDGVQCVASLVIILQPVVALASNVLRAMNLYDAYESFVDRMDLTIVAVAVFDAY